MVYDLQKASLWKRIAAWLFDAIIVGILSVGVGFLLSLVLGYDSYSQTVEKAYDDYEAAYGISFEISLEGYEALTEEQRKAYDDAYEALVSNEEVMYAYNMMLNLSLLITSIGIFVAILLWEFVLPLIFGNGQTLGKKIFGICLMRVDGVKVNTVQIFARALLGKYAIETMIPVAICLMLFWGTIGLFGTLFLLGLLIVQLACVAITRTNSAIHDLLAGTVVVDASSQMIFNSVEELIEFKKKVAAEQAMRQTY